MGSAFRGTPVLRTVIPSAARNLLLAISQEKSRFLGPACAAGNPALGMTVPFFSDSLETKIAAETTSSPDESP
jgi:hypothetical protein